MALRVCQGCTARFAVGLLACPHCRSTDHYEEGGVMPKITRHGGPSVAGAQVVGAAWSDSDQSSTWPGDAEEIGPEVEDTPAVSVDGIDQGPGEPVEFEGEPSFEPLPEAVEDDTAEGVSEPDYEALTVAQLREVLADRELPTSGTKAELVARLRTHDEP